MSLASNMLPTAAGRRVLSRIVLLCFVASCTGFSTTQIVSMSGLGFRSHHPFTCDGSMGFKQIRFAPFESGSSLAFRRNDLTFLAQRRSCNLPHLASMVAALERTDSGSDRLAELKKAAAQGKRRSATESRSPSPARSSAGFDLLRAAIENGEPLDDDLGDSRDLGRPLSVAEQLEADPLLQVQQRGTRSGRRGAVAAPNVGLSMLEMAIANGEPMDDEMVEQARAAPKRRAKAGRPPAKASARGRRPAAAAAAQEEEDGLALLGRALAGGDVLDDEEVERSRQRGQGRPRKQSGGAKGGGADAGLSLLQAAISAGEPMADERVRQVRSKAAAQGQGMAGRGGGMEGLEAVGGFGSAERVIPRMKRPEELRELLRILRTAFKGANGFEAAEVHAEEEDIQVVRLTGRAWLAWLRDNDLIDVGKDPGRHPSKVRKDFLAFWQAQGGQVPSKEEARAAVKAYEESRTERDVARACGYVEKLGMDYAALFGEAELEKVVQALAYRTDVDVATAGNRDLARRALGSTAIVEAYMAKGEAAEVLFGRENLLSADWDRAGMTYQEWEQRRVGMLRELLAHLAQQEAKPAGGAAVCDLAHGQLVDVQVKQRSALGLVVRVDGKYEGLVYDSDMFEEPPEIGEQVEGWVQKVREDGKVDVTLRPPGAKAKISDGVEKVLEALQKGKGRLELGDKSAPKEIYARLGLSKKVFKEALGSMYKRRMVLPDAHSVVLQPSSQWVTGLAKEAPPQGKRPARRGKAAAKAAAKKAAAPGKRRGKLESASKGAGEQRRQAEAMLAEDALAQKKESMKRLREQRAKERQAAQLAERVAEERRRLSPQLVEQRKQLLSSRPKNAAAGGGLKATLARLKASKLQKQRAQGSPDDDDAAAPAGAEQ